MMVADNLKRQHNEQGHPRVALFICGIPRLAKLLKTVLSFRLAD
jgi:hypothetical protein